MRKLFGLISLIFLLASESGLAQDSYLDSLKVAVDTTADDTTKIDNYLAISRYQAGYENDETIYYGNKAKELSERLLERARLANAIKWIGIGYYYKAENLVALDYFEKAYVEFEALDDKSGMANMLSLQGAINTNEGDETRGLELQFQALDLMNDVDDDFREASILVNIGNVYADKIESIDKAIEFYSQALPIFERLDSLFEISNVLVNMGDAYYIKEEYDKALEYYKESMEAYEGRDEMAYKLMATGKVFAKQKDFQKAIETLKRSYKMAVENGNPFDIAQTLIALGDVYNVSRSYNEAINSYLKAVPLIENEEQTDSKYKREMSEAYQGLSIAYSELGDFKNAIEYQEKLTKVNLELYESANRKQLDLINANFENEQQKGEIDLLTKEQALQEANLQKEKILRNTSFGGFILILIIAFVIYRNYRNKVKTNKLLDKQNEEIEGLLLNILPAEVAKELQHEGYATPQNYESATVLFTDFKGFTQISSGLLPYELIAELNSYFNEFDDIIGKHNLEKIKTIGDAYMCAGGIPSANTTHAIDAVEAGLAIQKYIARKNEKRKADGLGPWELRVGIHTGPIVAGVVGSKKYAYDIWGDTVNIASRMESSGEVGKVNVSEATYLLVKDIFECEYRGKISVKGAGEKNMYFVTNSN